MQNSPMLVYLTPKLLNIRQPIESDLKIVILAVSPTQEIRLMNRFRVVGLVPSELLGKVMELMLSHQIPVTDLDLVEIPDSAIETNINSEENSGGIQLSQIQKQLDAPEPKRLATNPKKKRNAGGGPLSAMGAETRTLFRDLASNYNRPFTISELKHEMKRRLPKMTDATFWYVRKLMVANRVIFQQDDGMYINESLHNRQKVEQHA